LQDFPRENLEQHPLVQQQATDPMIYCPERTRVRFSSYFHANWIQDLLPDREVIVAALPTASTLNAFWQLILEQEVQVVICCSHPADCSKPALVPYWPRGNDAYRSPAAHYSLQALFKEAGPPGVSAHYLELAHEQKKSRAHVLLIHIDGWKDFVTPPAAYIEGICHFIEEKSSFYPGRILFQSQSGAGRAGTLLASWLARQKMSEQYLITKTLPDFSSDWLYDLIYPLKRDRDFRLIRTDGQLEGLLGVIELTVKNILEQVQAQQEMEEKALSTPSSPAALPNYGPGSLG
jgi:protein tyrosine phosphatase